MSEAHRSATDTGGAPPNILFVPEAACSEVLQGGHSSRLACHPSFTRTLHLLRQRFWWLVRDARTFIAACPTCARDKSSHQLPAGLLHPLAIPRRPWSHIVMDFVKRPLPSQGHMVIMTVVDCFSRSAHSVPLPKLPSAAETGELLCRTVASPGVGAPSAAPPLPGRRAGASFRPGEPSSLQENLARGTFRSPQLLFPAMGESPQGPGTFFPPEAEGLAVYRSRWTGRNWPPVRWTFEVALLINPAAVHLRLPASMKVHPMFHVSWVKPMRARVGSVSAG